MQKIKNISINDYDYNLPGERIAKFPLPERDQSKLLVLKQNEVTEKKFTDLPELLPPKSHLIFNETKVIQARLLFRKPTGAKIELFCLEPFAPVKDFQLAFQSPSSVTWKCLIGNARRWKGGQLTAAANLDGNTIQLHARKIDSKDDYFLIEFTWEPAELTFAEIIDAIGIIPLPPYLKREAIVSDKERYQTVYARYEGSVAAPTAGLHFTSKVLNRIRKGGMSIDKVTLHVGAGTFKPVISKNIEQHEMHREQIIISLSMLKQLHDQIGNPVIPVGTTSMRTLESIYWLAVRLKDGKKPDYVDQWDPYAEQIHNLTPRKAIASLMTYLKDQRVDSLKAETRLMIAPGYHFKYATGLITNFHQPKSTLLLLVSALIGKHWKEAYDFALQHGFRFLSYGDSCLFLPQKNT